MKSSFVLNSTQNCKLQIIDKTDYSEKSSLNEYSYEDSITLDLVVNNTIDKDIIIYQKVNEHINKDIPEEILLQNDGKFTIYHIILPTKEWIEKNATYLIIELYDDLIYYDKSDKLFYKAFDFDTKTEWDARGGEEPLEPIDITYLKEINPIKSSIIRCKKSTFSICFLYKCYINYCRKVLNRNLSKCSNKKDKDLLFKRDFVWMTINVIKYYIELGQLEEAQRLLEETMSCNGFCKSHVVDYDLRNNTVSGCGCGN